MSKVMDDYELAANVLSHANHLAVQVVGATALTSEKKLTFELNSPIEDAPITIALERTLDNLAKLTRSADGQPYDRASIMYGDDDKARLLVVGAGHDIGIDARPTPDADASAEFFSPGPQLTTPSVLRVGQLALLVMTTAPTLGRIETAHADEFETMMTAAEFLGTDCK